eukprot:CAMPEP_0173426320 /NCGR_PEP_ID=MMETSP1357-20121228/5816_1 /TAXON_ID=77926 /ORGANISM="Hemiselmis rufescens, Strain PCC563" /LENGTH=42 /DNA_ID= /DNA_START= /DNA_END= /DNA_ORIENTATION=
MAKTETTPARPAARPPGRRDRGRQQTTSLKPLSLPQTLRPPP